MMTDIWFYKFHGNLTLTAPNLWPTRFPLLKGISGMQFSTKDIEDTFVQLITFLVRVHLFSFVCIKVGQSQHDSFI